MYQDSFLFIFASPFPPPCSPPLCRPLCFDLNYEHSGQGISTPCLSVKKNYMHMGPNAEYFHRTPTPCRSSTHQAAMVNPVLIVPCAK